MPRNLHGRHRQGELEKSGRRRRTAYSRPGFLHAQGGPIDTSALAARAHPREPQPHSGASAGRPGARREANYRHGGSGCVAQGSHRLVDHRHQQLSAAVLGRCERQILRLRVLPELVAGAVRRRTHAPERSAIKGHGGAGADAGQVAAQGSGERGGIHERPAIRCRCKNVPRRPHGHRGERAHRKRWSLEVREDASRRADHRWARQDTVAGSLGLPHAYRRRLHRPAGIVDGRDVVARSGQRRFADDRPAQPRQPR